MLGHADFERFNLFRKPEWRFDRIRALLEAHPTPKRCSSRDDEYVKIARNFLLRWKNREDDGGRRQLFHENPGLFYAIDLYEKSTEDPVYPFIIQARLLAGMTSDEIAEVMPTTADTIDWYERLFFNINDRLDKRDWVTKMILVPSVMRSLFSPRQSHHVSSNNEQAIDRTVSVCDPFYDGTLKLFAYFGGRHVLEPFLASCDINKKLSSPEKLNDWLDEYWTGTIRRRSAQAATKFDLNRYNVSEVFNLHSQLLALDRSSTSLRRNDNDLTAAVGSMINGIDWLIGDKGKKTLAKTKLGRYDEEAAELRADEVLKVTSGYDDTNIRAEVTGLALPSPRQKTNDSPKELADNTK